MYMRGLLRAITSIYHSSSIAPHKVIPFLTIIVRDASARTSTSISAHLKDYIDRAPILCRLIHLCAVNAKEGIMPDGILPLLNWLIVNDQIIHTAGIHNVCLFGCLFISMRFVFVFYP